MKSFIYTCILRYWGVGTSTCEFGEDTIQPILAGEVVQTACNWWEKESSRSWGIPAVWEEERRRLGSQSQDWSVSSRGGWPLATSAMRQTSWVIAKRKAWDPAIRLPLDSALVPLQSGVSSVNTEGGLLWSQWLTRGESRGLSEQNKRRPMERVRVSVGVRKDNCTQRNKIKSQTNIVYSIHMHWVLKPKNISVEQSN